MADTDTRPRYVAKCEGFCSLCSSVWAVAELTINDPATRKWTDSYFFIRLCSECIIRARRGFPRSEDTDCRLCDGHGDNIRFPVGCLCDTCCAALKARTSEVLPHVRVLTPASPDFNAEQTESPTEPAYLDDSRLLCEQSWMQSYVPFYPHPTLEPGYRRVHGGSQWTWGGFFRAWWRKLTGKGVDNG